jgi:hypothetical protein
MSNGLEGVTFLPISPVVVYRASATRRNRVGVIVARFPNDIAIRLNINVLILNNSTCGQRHIEEPVRIVRVEHGSNGGLCCCAGTANTTTSRSAIANPCTPPWLCNRVAWHRWMLPLHFLAFFFGLAGRSSVASTVREISRSVTPFDTAFRTAFLIRFTAFFCFSFPSAIDYA